MAPEEIKIISGVLTAVGFICLLRQLHWQVRIGLIDRQSKSAFAFLLLTTLIIGQLVLSYLGVVPFGTTERGPIFYVAWVGSVVWWNVCTERHNAAALKRIREAEDRMRKPLDSVLR